MDDDRNRGMIPSTEDYGSGDSDPTLTEREGSIGDKGYDDRTDSDITAAPDYGTGVREAADRGDDEGVNYGKYSGGTEGTQPHKEGEYFGEFDDTGTGVDLTKEMDSFDPRAGQPKGGGAIGDDVAGPAQYGGQAGSLTDKPSDS